MELIQNMSDKKQEYAPIISERRQNKHIN